MKKPTPEEIKDIVRLIGYRARKNAEREKAFRFAVGTTYETLAGNLVTVTGRTGKVGYECLICSDGKHRHDRSTGGKDAGRVTGTAHDYSCQDNFKPQ